MSQTTPNLGLQVPARGDLDWDVQMNANLFTIDGIVIPGVNPLVYGPTITADVTKGTTCTVTLTGTPGSTNFTGAKDGQVITVVVYQDSVGGHSFPWASNFVGAGEISSANNTAGANTLCVQSFVRSNATNKYYATSALVYMAE